MSSNPASSSVSSFTGDIPRLYDTHLGPVIFEFYARDLSRRLEPRPGMAVLETASGTGIVTRRLVERLPADGRLVSTDLNPAMLEYAATRLPADPRVERRPADAQELPFGDASFDAVVCQFGVMFFPDRPRAMRETKRVLKPGGTLLFNVWDRLDANPPAAMVHETVGRVFPSDPPTFCLTPFGWNDPADIRATLEGAGLRDVRIEPLGTTSESASSHSYATGLVRGNPMANAIAERGGDAEAIVREVASRIASRYGEPPRGMPMRALVVTARA